jgi:hypothetical protein
MAPGQGIRPGGPHRRRRPPSGRPSTPSTRRRPPRPRALATPTPTPPPRRRRRRPRPSTRSSRRSGPRTSGSPRSPGSRQAITAPGLARRVRADEPAAIEAKSTVQEFELAILRSARPRPRPAAPASGGRSRPSGDLRAGAAMIEAAICRAGGLERPEKRFDERTLEAADARFRNGIGLCDAISIAARENGWTGPLRQERPRGGAPRRLPAADPGIRADGARSRCRTSSRTSPTSSW